MGRTFFRRANLIDGCNAPRKNSTVVVEGNRIAAVAANGDAPKPNANRVGRICDGPDEFRKAVRDEIKQGVEIVKLYPTGGHGLPGQVA
jgi:hypothetical protein